MARRVPEHWVDAQVQRALAHSGTGRPATPAEEAAAVLIQLESFITDLRDRRLRHRVLGERAEALLFTVGEGQAVDDADFNQALMVAQDLATELGWAWVQSMMRR